MAKSPGKTFVLSDLLKQYGLICFGGLEISSDLCASDCVEMIGKKGLLIGNAGKDMWKIFSQSSEFCDHAPDPMNRWTKRILDGVADELGGRAVYPFDEPYWPFQRIAQKAAGVKPSPLGILIHPEFGLWHAFRGLMIFDKSHEFTIHINDLLGEDQEMIHPCDTCLDKPCLSACPVGAFTGTRLDVQSCFAHLDSQSDPDCMKLGCQARCACPIAKEHQHAGAQMKFHMKSYRGF